MRIAGWIGAGLLALVLIVFAIQNTVPSLPLVILGFRTPMLPLAVWLIGAIALGALTTTVLVGVSGNINAMPAKSNRRRWQVRSKPEHPPRAPDPRQRPFRQRPVNEPRFTRDYGDAPRDRPPGQPDEDWADWGQRFPASQWQDWEQAPQDPTRASQDPTRRIPKRQQQAESQASEDFEDIATGWDDRATNTPYRPTGASPVEDALDEIAEGWEDWEDPEEARRDNAPESRPIYEVRRSPESVSKSGTSYSYRYRSADDLRRQPSSTQVSSSEPPESADADAVDSNPDLGLDAPEVGPDGVYDADYRVIIPPSRPLEEDADLEGDRP
jgi:uncharacterized integral membrane protein